MKKVHKSSGTDDKKLQTSLKKLNVQPIQAIEEVNMFKEDGNVIHFAAPKGTLVPRLVVYHARIVVHELVLVVAQRRIGSRSVCTNAADLYPSQFMRRSHPTPLPYTATVKIRNSRNSCPAS